MDGCLHVYAAAGARLYYGLSPLGGGNRRRGETETTDRLEPWLQTKELLGRRGPTDTRLVSRLTHRPGKCDGVPAPPPDLGTYLLWAVHRSGSIHKGGAAQARGVRRGSADPHFVSGKACFIVVCTPTWGLIYELEGCDGVPRTPTGPLPGLGTGLLNPGRCTHLVSRLVSRPGGCDGVRRPPTWSRDGST